MKAVIDSCVAIKTALPEEGSDKAVRLRDDYINGLCELIAPNVFPVEFAHAMTRAHRKGIVLADEVRQAVADLFAVLPELHDSLTLLPLAIDMSLQARIGVYDCLYLALAERENCSFITADAKLKPFPRVILLADIP